jgi:protein tyrosine phosphatase (PTP) superfamily phosphohydrolase (DUF442 family)
MPSRRRPVPLAAVAIAVLGACALASGEKVSDRKAFEPVPTTHLQNVHRVTADLVSGSAPDGDGAFEELKRLGIKSIISVDGARPDVERARRFGMRYVHLPIGYDDVTPQEGKALAKAIDELEGPVYVHCHHGKHRSAAAVAVACVMNGKLKPAQAESVLYTFGTGENYKGLWASARDARPVDAEELRALKLEFVETAKVPPMADAMVAIDHTWEHLKQAEEAGWKAPIDHPDLDPPHEALQLMEHFRELGRTTEVAARPADFRQKLAESEAAANRLHEMLVKWSGSGRTGVPPAEAGEVMKTLSNSCAACHRQYRD